MVVVVVEVRLPVNLGLLHLRLHLRRVLHLLVEEALRHKFVVMGHIGVHHFSRTLFHNLYCVLLLRKAFSFLP